LITLKTIVPLNNAIKTAENVAKYQKKGSLLFIEGVLEQRRYTNHAGEKRTTYEVIADRVLFLEPKPAETQDSDENTKAPEQQPVPNSDNSEV
jgi:single-strand DNA-binding protein